MGTALRSLSPRLRADAMLLTTAIIWGSAFVAQRVVAVETNVFIYNGLRFFVGALALTPLLRREKSASSQGLWGVVGVGAILFAAAAFQQFGLRYTTAGNAGFITGLYVVFIPLFLAMGTRRLPAPVVWGASSTAVLGLFLLSTGGELQVNPGDALELAGAALWALHVIWVGRLVRTIPVVRLSVGQYLVCGALNLAVGLLSDPAPWGGMLAASWSILYVGLFSVGIGYTFQAAGQREAPPADAAILLNGEAVFAAMFGWLLLDERLTGVQILGAALIFAAMLLAQAPRLRRNRT